MNCSEKIPLYFKKRTNAALKKRALSAILDPVNRETLRGGANVKNSEKAENEEIKAPLIDSGDFVYETEYSLEHRKGFPYGKWLLFAGLAVCAAVLALLIVRLPGSSDTKEAFTENTAAAVLGVEVPQNPGWSWFRGGNVRYENEPFLVFSGDVEVVEADGAEMPMWVCRLKIRETTGIGFVPEQIEQYEYRSESDCTKSVFSADSLWQEPDTGDWEFGSGMTVGDILGFGYVIRGSDPDGRKITFRAFIDLKQAPRTEIEEIPVEEDEGAAGLLVND